MALTAAERKQRQRARTQATTAERINKELLKSFRKLMREQYEIDGKTTPTLFDVISDVSDSFDFNDIERVYAHLGAGRLEAGPTLAEDGEHAE